MSTKKTGSKYWSHKVKTVSTYPPASLFTKDAQAIAKAMASKKISPKGVGSGIRMIQFFINRAGKNLSPALDHFRRVVEMDSANAVTAVHCRACDGLAGMMEIYRNLDSFERYCMSTFPFLLALALVTDREEAERGAYVLAAAGLVGYATLAFLGISGP